MSWYKNKEYQRMCKGVVSSLNEPGEKIRWGDFYLLNGRVRLWAGEREINPEHRIKLYSQEDLQEIYCKHFEWNWAQMERHFHEWIFMSRTEVWDSREKALLAFIMDKVFGLPIWNPKIKKWESLK